MKIPAMKPVKSSNVWAVGHEPDTKTLHVQFKNNKGQPGSHYAYFPVEPVTLDAMLEADSIGQFLNANIKANQNIQHTKIR
jgi:KTSC domain